MNHRTIWCELASAIGLGMVGFGTWQLSQSVFWILCGLVVIGLAWFNYLRWVDDPRRNKHGG
jgi:hypothetical protein